MQSYRLVAASFLFFVSSISLAQTSALLPNVAVIGSEGGIVTAISDPSAVLQFGTGTSWCAPFVASNLTLPAPVNYGTPVNTQLCPIDPAPNVVKQLVAQRAAVSYTVTYAASNGLTSLIVIPGLVPAVPPAQTAALLPNVTVVGAEGGIVTAISNPSAVLQFGTGASWCAPFVASNLTLPAPVNYGTPVNTQLCPIDPAPNVVKQLVAQRVGADYTVSFTDANNVSSVVLIPGLSIVAAPPVTLAVPVASAVAATGAACGQANSVWWEIAGGTPSSVVLQPGTTYMLGTSSTCIVAPSLTTISLSTGNLFILRTGATQYAQLTNPASPNQVTSIEVAGVRPWASIGTYLPGETVSLQGQFWSAALTSSGISPTGSDPGTANYWLAQPSICNTVTCP